jgi:ribosomal-protein-alanine N-acetyltransferase
MEYAIRDVGPDDIPQIEEIEKRCFSLPWTAEQLAGQMKGAQHEFIAAADESGTVLGYVGMMFVLDEGYISNVAVAPEARRQGIADALIARLEEICGMLALSFVSLEVRAGNAPAIALYEKHGFRRVGLRKNYYERPREDALIMTKFWNRGNTLENTCI